MSLSTGCVLDVDASAIESGISRDRNHHTLTPTDCTTVRGKAGKGTYFNGTTSFVDCGNDPSLKITDAITIEGLIKPEVVIGGLSHGIVGYPDIINWILYHYDSRLYFRYKDVDDGTQTLEPGVDHLVANEYTYAVMTYTDSTHTSTFYSNGALIGSDSGTKDMKTTNFQNIYIGLYSTFYFNGTISSVKIYNYALSPTQIKRHYLEKAYLYVPHPVRIP